MSQPTPPPIDQLFHQMVKNGASDLNLNYEIPDRYTAMTGVTRCG